MKSRNLNLGVVFNACNRNICDDKAGRLFKIQGCSELFNECQSSLSYSVRPCLKKVYPKKIPQFFPHMVTK